MSTPTYAQFLADPDRVENVTLELYPRSIALPAVYLGLYFTMQEFGTLLDEIPSGAYVVPSGQLFARRIDGGFQRQSSDPGNSGSTRFLYGFIPQNAGGTITLFQRHGDIDLGYEPPELLDVPIRQYTFGGRRAVVRHGGRCSRGDMALADYRILLDGEAAGQPLVEADKVTFILRGKDHRLDQPLLTRKLYGTDWCVYLDGTSDGYIDFGSYAAHNITSELFKIEFLIWLESYPGATRVILTHGSASAGGTDGYRIQIDSSGIVGFGTYQAGATQLTTLSELPLKQWVRVSFLRTTTALITGYYDGVDATISHATHINPANNSARTLYVGRDNANTLFLECVVDDIRIATDSAAGLDEDTVDLQCFRELSDTEAADYVLYAKCNERPPGFGGTPLYGGTAPDSSPTGADGTLSDDGAGTAGALFVPSGMGRTDAAGDLIPLLLGEKEGITPQPNDLAVALHMVSASAVDFLDVRIGLRPDALDNSIATAYTNFFAFLIDIALAQVPDGSYSTYVGDYWTMICFGDSPNHSITVHATGSITTPVALVRNIVTTYGSNPFIDPDEITTAEFDALEALHPEKCGLYVTNEDTIQTVIDAFLINIGAAMWVSDATGKLRIKVIGDGLDFETPVTTLTRRNVEMGSLKVQEGGNPYWKINVFYNQCPTPMTTGGILEEMYGTEIEAFHKNEWRTKSAERRVLRRIFLDAAEYDIHTTILEDSAAQEEASRLSNLLRRPDQGFSFFSKHIEEELELYDAVIFHYTDLDPNGEEQSRYGTSETSLFYVVGIRLAIGRGGFDIALWRPRVQ